ncbi:MAG TPA: Si-specific NAD(P)(+) transhydrogenase [Candidatus Saccharimonadaceae bacterium]|nr:Si-specific NAD(P)(+) transhydrogenase [Candidatus Saccharimonadaceae bacterium]
MTTKFDLVVLGSGPGGQRAAVQAAKLGKRVAVVERMTVVGGGCINTGTIPSKTLREAVIDLSGLRQRALYGDAFRAKSDITAQDLLLRTGIVMARERDVVKAQLQRNGVRVLDGTGRFVDAHHVSIEGDGRADVVECDFVVIAVGSTPGLPDGLTVDHKMVLTSDDILQLTQLPRTMTVVGAGVIGMEYATMFAALGIEVTVLDKRDTLLEMVDREIVEALMHESREMGMTFRLGEEVAGLEFGGEAHVVVQTKSGKRMATDMVLVSAGRVGNTAGLDLANAGVSADARGRISVNEHYQTMTPNIYAVGDVIGFPALAATSMEQGRLASCHAFGVPAHSVPALFPFGIYAIPEIAWVGSTEEELTAKGTPYETGVARYKEIARGQILGDLHGMLKLLIHLETRHILGVWVVGSQATELVHIGQAVMALGGTLEYFLNSVFNYPTLAECYKVAALDGYNKLRVLGMAPATVEGTAT